MKRLLKLQRIPVYVVLLISLAITNASPSESGLERLAIIENIQHHDKIMEGEVEVLNVTARNIGIEAEPARFFLRVYIDQKMIFDEYPNAWDCPMGSEVSRSMHLPTLLGPKEYDIELELWWLNQSTVKQDRATFTLKVVKLQIEWVQSPIKVTVNSRSPLQLKTEFRNGGNDVMFRTTIRVVDEAGLSFSPKILELGDIDASQDREARFEVSGLEEASIGEREARFEITYYDFKGGFHSETFSNPVTVTKMNTNLILSSPGRAQYGSDVTVRARLLDGDGNPLAGQTVLLRVGDKEWAEVTNGTGYVETKLSIDLGSGEYLITAEYTGAERYGGSTSTAPLVVTQASTKLDLNVKSGLTVNDPIFISALLLDKAGNPISGAEIEFWIDSQKTMVKASDINGAATAAIKLERKGEYAITARFNGSSQYEPATSSTKIFLRGLGTSIKISGPSLVVKGSPFTLRIELLDERGRPVPNANLKVAITDNKGRSERTLITGEDGIAQGEFIPRYSGKVDATIIYEGNEEHDGAEKILSITVIDYPVVALILSLSLIPIAAVLAFLELKTRGLSSLLSRIVGGGHAPHSERAQLKPPPNILSRRCLSCGTEIPASSKFCDICGSSQEPSLGDSADEVVYRYILEKGGTISLTRASADLHMSPEDLRRVIDRLRMQGRLEEEGA